MKKLSEYTAEELAEEIMRRKRKHREPKPFKEVDWSKVYAAAQASMRFAEDNNREEPDTAYWTWDAVMIAVFGGDVWPYYNGLLR